MEKKESQAGINNLAYKIIAILISVALWFYVSDLQNPVLEKTIPIDIQYTSLSEDLVLSSKEKTVSVVVQGEKKVIDALGPQDFLATIDLKDMGLGEKNYPVNVKSLAAVEIIRLNPKEVKIVADKLATKQIPVQTFLYGEVAPGYKNYRPEVNPSQVVIKGSEKQLKEVVSALIDINLNYATENIKLNLPIKLQDSQNNWLDLESLFVLPESAEVFVPVSKDMPEKTVSIKPILEGTPAEDFEVSRVVLEPEVVKLLGEYSTLEAVDIIQTIPVDITGISEDITRDVALDIPQDIVLLYGTRVKIMVQIREKPVSKNFKLAVAVVNPSADFKATLSPSEVTIRAVGEKEAVGNLLTSNFIASVDVANLGEGVFEVPVDISGPNSIDIQQLTPPKIKVTIKKIEKPVEPEEQGDSTPGSGGTGSGNTGNTSNTGLGTGRTAQ